ncbi:hypothetical protein [Crocosphaera sp. XPORK-15E]|uniref:hypothetical protein n=1 Tax=Crocosphaera sp. XPORK-15E TaxID=3110247 RepID=UPI002B1E96CE|nr:hypothetical protein [Crocosphaera sp. XPORK-15E]MEA5534011.1 hypothetical protein [Crocosphaera sp. XPORK-15E]
MKYFFLAEGWTVGRVWELGHLWDTNSWRRPPYIQRIDIGIPEEEDIFWLYEIEEAVLMVEIKPLDPEIENSAIGQVVLKRLINAEQVLDKLRNSSKIFKKET